ncbi:hypothetical protein CPLU01_14519 [Colletotrichum plurivorum]|uniref:Lysine-specific metallo-endopeptidase domain-containing protein n=1 Tax=Colletotrichum plurivorum TaxID=2175906 RepID=A0A8H6JJT1_9PEZI|nr:hypothetical protein CPLU01_14519 [Colletotrichum plurivorum]
MLRLRTLLKILLAVVPGALSALNDPAKKTKDLFVVDFASTNRGGCQNVGEAAMDGMIKDCLTLAQAGLKAIDEHGSKPEAARLLTAFFTIPSIPLQAADLANIKARYETVRNWLQQGGPTDDGRQPNKPHLYCYHEWLDKKTFRDPALDNNGQPVKNNRGTVQTFGDVYPANVNSGVIPYWSPQFKVVVWDSDYGDPAGGIGGYCHAADSAAATSHQPTASVITLCPSSYGGANPLPRTPAIMGPRSVAANAVANDVVKRTKKGNQALPDIYPTAVTLFHELFHLILGNDKTTMTGSTAEQYIVARMIKLRLANSLRNPETFTAVAAAYDFTSNTPADSSGNRVEFSTGWATQGLGSSIYSVCHL